MKDKISQVAIVSYHEMLFIYIYIPCVQITFPLYFQLLHTNKVIVVTD